MPIESIALQQHSIEKPMKILRHEIKKVFVTPGPKGVENLISALLTLWWEEHGQSRASTREFLKGVHQGLNDQAIDLGGLDFSDYNDYNETEDSEEES